MVIQNGRCRSHDSRRRHTLRLVLRVRYHIGGCGSSNHSVSGSDLLPGKVNPHLSGSNQLLGGGSSVDVDDGYTLGVPVLLLSIIVGVVPLLGNTRMVVAITSRIPLA